MFGGSRRLRARCPSKPHLVDVVLVWLQLLSGGIVHHPGLPSVHLRTDVSLKHGRISSPTMDSPAPSTVFHLYEALHESVLHEFKLLTSRLLVAVDLREGGATCLCAGCDVSSNRVPATFFSSLFCTA